MTDMSRSPTSDMCSVRGMGVAEERQRVHVFAHFLEALFVGHPKTLFLVHDQQADGRRI